MIYGALGNIYFKFYDLRNAESITRSGRETLMHMVRKTAEIIDGEYIYPSKSIVYGDTDSCALLLNTDNLEIAKNITKNVLTTVNDSFPKFLTDTFYVGDKFNKVIKAENEFISDRSIFVKKKLYVMHLCYKNGKEVDEMKTMGLQLKKTTIPKAVGKKLTYFIQELLKGKQWNVIGKEIVAYKDELLTTVKILDIGLPGGVNKVELYTDNYNVDNKTRLPGRVAASIHWNECLKKYNDTDSEVITSGAKVKVYYLRKTFGRFKTIAVPVDTKKMPGWFNENYLPLIDKNLQAEKLINLPLQNILKAINKKIPTKKSLLLDELGEY